MSKLPLYDLPLQACGLKVLIPPSLRGPPCRNLRWRWRLAVLYPDRFCSYCGERRRLTIDHVRPRADGGADALRNMVPACESCNNLKSDMSLLMFLWRRAGWCS